MSENPLVSFCVKCFNQVDLIVPALEGAFAQTYRPMEIVISDDCSKDGSGAVIERMIVEYRAKGGDIPITFLRQTVNQGNLANWQRICEVAKGELLIKADGDDISLPNRTEEVVKAWLADGREALIITNAHLKIDQAGAILDNRPALTRNLGATSTYSRRLVDDFATIIADESNRFAADDVVYGARASMLGGTTLNVNTPLVRYRLGSGVSSGMGGYRRFMTYGMRSIVLSVEQMLSDLSDCKSNIPQQEKKRLAEAFKARRISLEKQLTLWDDKSFPRRLVAFRMIWPSIRFRPGLCVIYVLLLIGVPNIVFDLGLKMKYFLCRVRLMLNRVRVR